MNSITTKIAPQLRIQTLRSLFIPQILAPFLLHLKSTSHESSATATRKIFSSPVLSTTWKKLLTYSKVVTTIRPSKSFQPYTIVAAAGFIGKADTRIKVTTNQKSNFKHDAGEDAFLLATDLEIKTPVSPDSLSSFSSSSLKNADPSSTTLTTVAALGVADGVGGYARLGIDSSLLAWKIMENAQECLLQQQEVECPKKLIEVAYNTVKSKQQVAAGGTTACVLLLHQEFDGSTETYTSGLKLSGAHLGDSAYMVLRNGKKVFKSVDQTHAFNTPFQLAIPPKGHPRQVYSDDPCTAELLQQPLELEDGDIILIGTDGYFDNVFDHETEQLVERLQKTGASIKDCCEQLVSYARTKAQNPVADTPFAKYALENNKYYNGGKMDDITVVIGRVAARSAL